MRTQLVPSIKRLAAGLVVAAVVFYLIEDFSIRIRLANGADLFGSVPVNGHDSIPQKNGATEAVPADAAPQACLHSVFPHLGDSPCWYVESHKNTKIDS
jgi:hypothetical protein